MIESIEFTNFKALRQTTLPLSPFTLLLGPNGSGKSSVLQAIQMIAEFAGQNPEHVTRGDEVTVGSRGYNSLLSVTAENKTEDIAIQLRVRFRERVFAICFRFRAGGNVIRTFDSCDGNAFSREEGVATLRWLNRMCSFGLDPAWIARPIPVTSAPLLQNGGGLAAVLDDLKDKHPERWELLLDEMREWLPEYDHILFDKPADGQKAIALRTRNGRHSIPASELSQGTLVALALLALAYSPNPPSVIGLEEIDRGLHPRLLRHLQDALYRLSYPESCGEKRPPIQVIATTHSPYLLDLYRDHPEEIVLAQKEGLEVKFNRLKDVEHFDDILGDSPLSEVWYSGVLGGVAVKP